MKTACIQTTATADIDENLSNVTRAIREAAKNGARLISTPENTDYIRRYAKDKLEISGDAQTHKPIAHYAALAKELGVWLLIGSLGVKISEDRLANRQHLFAPDGRLVDTYDKIHMFDVTLSRAEFYKESSDYKPGERAVVAPLEGGLTLGMSICYDVRFAYLYRALAQAGANILSVPAAFTVPTGQAHWETLLRARAIETGCYVIAPAQCGEHEGGRKTYGYSMIISPWGEVLAQAGSEQSIIYADITLDEIEKARHSIPALTHDREFKIEG
ncbi:MAG: carbon-nitrogen hydrolase family protein [Micavibrio sp.]|nr:carbon-nitrogen hydrolase family protein [Micavibrio sp.]